MLENKEEKPDFKDKIRAIGTLGGQLKMNKSLIRKYYCPCSKDLYNFTNLRRLNGTGKRST